MIIDRSLYSVEARGANVSAFSAAMHSRLEGVYGDTKLMQILYSHALQKRFNAVYDADDNHDDDDDDHDDDDHDDDSDSDDNQCANMTKESSLPAQCTMESNRNMHSNVWKVQSVCVHPGFVWSQMGHSDSRWMQKFIILLRPLLARDPFQGALSTVYAATDSQYIKGGEYIENGHVSKPSMQYASVAEMDKDAEWLWSTSNALTTLPT
jgi:hypothetical protein